MNTLASVQMLDAVTSSTNFEGDIAGALGYGIPLSLFGFATVFAVLILIWGILALFKVFFYTIPNARKSNGTQKSVQGQQKKQPEQPKVEEAPVQTVAPVSVPVQSSNDGEIVAAIIAAIESYRAQSSSTAPSGFRVVSFKKRY